MATWPRSPRAIDDMNLWATAVNGPVKYPVIRAKTDRVDVEVIGPSEALDLETECGSGLCQQLAGDFLFHCHVAHHYVAGMWGYWRVYNTLQSGNYPFGSTDIMPPLQELPDRKGRIKLYVKRVFITDEAEILPRYLRFVRGLVDSADLPLNVSREMIQESPIFAAIKRGVTNRVLGDLEKVAENEPESYAKIWTNFGAVLKEGLYEDYERRDTLYPLLRFKTTVSGESWRSLKDYVASLKENQTAIYYLVGDDLARLDASPHLEGFRARGIEVLLLADPVDSFWVAAAEFGGKPFKSVTQGAADLALIPVLDDKSKPAPEASEAVNGLIAFIKDALGEAVADVRPSERLTDSAVCLVASEFGPDRQLEKLLASAGRLKTAAKPILEINPRHDMIVALASLSDDDRAFKQDAAHLLFDEARLLDGERPPDPKLFSDRLARVLMRSLGKDKD